MDDKIAETVEREASWLRGMDATRSADLLEALARDLAAERDRAEKAEAERDDRNRQIVELNSLSTARLRKLLYAQADRDRLAKELAEARTVLRSIADLTEKKE